MEVETIHIGGKVIGQVWQVEENKQWMARPRVTKSSSPVATREIGIAHCKFMDENFGNLSSCIRVH